MPMTRPELPTYRSHPNVEACSTATRAVTPGGSTLSRYSRVWCSKISHDGIETTRERMPSASSLPWAHRQTQLAARGDEDHLGIPARGIGEHVGAARDAGAGSELREDRIEVLDHRRLAADHQAVPSLPSPDATAGPDVDVVDALRRELLGASEVVDVVG